jgi:hypothetical protein
MIFAAPAIILPPEKPAIVRASDMKGLPSWQEMQRREKALKLGTFAFPFVPPAASTGPSISFRTSSDDGTNGTVYSFASIDIGTASGTRTVIVGAVGLTSGGGTASFSSLSIGGVGATQQKLHSGGGGAFALIFNAAVPTGATGTISYTSSLTLARTQIMVWAAYDLASATAAATAGSSSQSASVNMNTLAGDVLVVVGYSNDQASPGVTPTGYTERVDAASSEGTAYSGGDFTCVANETPRTITMGWTSLTNGATAAASFR